MTLETQDQIARVVAAPADALRAGLEAELLVAGRPGDAERAGVGAEREVLEAFGFEPE